jgi:hypothetical protein
LITTESETDILYVGETIYQGEATYEIKLFEIYDNGWLDTPITIIK